MKVIDGEMYFTKKEVADMVGRTPLTIHNYDNWSNEREANGEERFLPKPLLVGRYRYWNMSDIQKIKDFFEWVESNRGALADYSRRCWSKDMKDKKSEEK